MIPKTIHYCWLSGDPMPRQALKCMQSWKSAMPDYRIVLWDTSRFDIDSHPFVREACSVKKWPFAADYIRLHALYTEGGIYLDSDVAVRKPFDEFLQHRAFTAVEYNPDAVASLNTLSLLNPDGTSKTPHTAKPGFGIQAATVASEPRHPFIKACMDWYADKHFILEDDSYHMDIIAPDIYGMVAEDFGFRYADERQVLREDVLVLPSEIVATLKLLATEHAYAIHLCANSWVPDYGFTFWEAMNNHLRRNDVLRWLFRKKVVRPFAGPPRGRNQ